MVSVAKTVQSAQSVELKVAALECLVQIAAMYYAHLNEYMLELGPLTWGIIKGGEDRLCIPALEFWNTICDVELERIDDPNSDVKSEGDCAISLGFIFSLFSRGVPLHHQAGRGVSCALAHRVLDETRQRPRRP